jgi:hypothetical protein
MDPTKCYSRPEYFPLCVIALVACVYCFPWFSSSPCVARRGKTNRRDGLRWRIFSGGGECRTIGRIS